MRGIAAIILWEKATDYKMTKDWTNFGAMLNQITKVQPNFLSIGPTRPGTSPTTSPSNSTTTTSATVG